MNKFLIQVLRFFLVLFLILLLGIFLPPTPKVSNSHIFSNISKDSMMLNILSPRMIFIGGSNVSFSLNSQIIKDSLHVNPINTGIDASVGLSYMMRNALEYIKAGDIVILMPEYQHFFEEFAYGTDGEELTRTIFDVNLNKIKLLSVRQLINVMKMIPKYALSKFNIGEYYHIKESDIYNVKSYNSYGDVYTHWHKKNESFEPYGKLGTNLNQSLFKEIKDFQIEIEKRNASFFVTYPCYQDISYRNSEKEIKEIEMQFHTHGYHILGTSHRYVFPDSMMFNTPYHLNKIGLDCRTQFFIEDYGNANTQLVHK